MAAIKTDNRTWTSDYSVWAPSDQLRTVAEMEYRFAPELKGVFELSRQNIVTLSTGHMTADDNKLLAEFAKEGEVSGIYATDAGFIVSTSESTVRELTLRGASHALCSILVFFRKVCDVVRFDRDARQHPHIFPVFDW